MLPTFSSRIIFAMISLSLKTEFCHRLNTLEEKVEQKCKKEHDIKYSMSTVRSTMLTVTIKYDDVNDVITYWCEKFRDICNVILNLIKRKVQYLSDFSIIWL